MDKLFAAGETWTDMHGETHENGLDDILIVAPYNAHIMRSGRRSEDARVGTVEKVQDQEAPIVICSMAISRPEAAPRGREFLYAADRLNVATSRARCVAVVVAEPALLRPKCKLRRQMWLAKKYFRLREDG